MMLPHRPLSRAAACLFLATATLLASPSTSDAATFHPIAAVGSSTSGTDLWPASNLIQGPGFGFSAAEPHDKTSTDAAGNWVTDAPGGFPSDYIAVAGAPVITLDLGGDVPLDEISVWGYSDGNANGVSAFSLRFATEADGPGGFGTSVTYNPSFTGVLNAPSAARQSFAFSNTVTARYVEFTATDNHFGGPLPGGDRVGLGEIAFEVPESTGDPEIEFPPAIGLELTGGVDAFDITVRNSGGGELVVDSAGFTGPNAAAFSLISLPAPIPAGGEDVVIIGFDAGGLGGAVTATLTLSSNDPSNPSVSSELTGFVHDPRIEASPAGVNFGLVAPDAGIRSIPLRLRNLGGGNTLVVSGVQFSGADRARFALLDVPGSIAPLSDADVTVTFDPAGASGSISAQVEILTNDPVNPRLPIALSARVGAAPPVSAVRISEFVASNREGIEDGDGIRSDWIEIHNEGPGSVDLAGWHLTDDPDDLEKWTFPSVTLAERGYLIVFASGRGDPVYVDGDGRLHTNFRLASSGDYLALVEPDGTTIASEFAPAYPPQFTDIAYGSFRSGGSVVNVIGGSDAAVLIPSDGSLGESWTLPSFVPGAGWIAGAGQAVGFDAGSDYLPFITTDVSTAMRGINATCYVRLPFEVADPSIVEALTLRMRFDDGFVAYLNGVEIASRNAPGSPAWNSVATTSNPDSSAVVFLDLDVSEFVGDLVAGTNVLAVHGLNSSVGSSDFLMQAELVARQSGDGPLSYSYLLAPTPGAANSDLVGNPGPEIAAPTHSPAAPTANDPIVVTASVAPRLGALGEVTLTYRVMYGTESTVSMADDGASPDTVAGDGVYAGTIPSSAFGPGDMVRWRIDAMDAAGNGSRLPAFLDRTGNGQSPEYLGTVIEDPNVTSDIPLFLWFTQNVSASHTRSGARASVYFLGRFYDNLFVRQRGGATNASVSQKFDFNSGDNLFINDEMPSVGEINMNGPGSDSSYVRQPLAFESYRTAGNASCLSELWQMRVNKNFDRVGIFIEQVDDDFLDRNGYDRDGDLYKFVQRSNLNPVFADTITGIEKKTGDLGDLSTVQALVAGLNLPSSAQRRAFVFDHIDLPQVLNYLAVRSITQDADDVRKNFYMYVDHRGDELWRIFPWDKDWTFGVTGDGGTFLPHPFFGDQEHAKQNANQWNILYDVLFEESPITEMYLRRLRTVMEEVLQPLSTPSAERILETRTDEIFAPAATLLGGGPASAKNGIFTYLNQRRNILFGTYGPNGSTPLIPDSQPPSPDLDIVEVDYNPTSGNQDEEFVRIANNESTEIDISGWSLEGGVDFTFAPGTVVPRNASIHVSPNVTAFRQRTTSPKGGEQHVVVGPFGGHLSSFGETLILRDRSGRLVSEFSYIGEPSDAQRHLVVSEIMYHPADPAPNAEFLEITNISDSVTVDLSGVRFTAGVEFDFAGSAITSLAPGQRALVVLDRAAFESVHGAGLPIAGEFENGTRLGNDGELLKLEDATNSTIKEFAFNDRTPWPEGADGFGPSLVLARPGTNPDPSIPGNWRLSAAPGGSPGSADPTSELTGPPDADADADGISALVEHALGLSDSDPSDASAGLSVSLDPLSGSIEVAFPRNFAADDVLVDIEVSGDLGSWRIVEAGESRLLAVTPTGPTTGRETWEVTPTTGSSRQFVRLRVTQR